MGRRQWHFADHQLGLKQMLAGEQNPSLTVEYIPRGKVLETIPQSIYTLTMKFLILPKTNQMTVSSKRSMLKISLCVPPRWPITMIYSGLNKASLELRESRKLSE